MGRRRRSTTASCAGPSAASGSTSLPPSPAAGTLPRPAPDTGERARLQGRDRVHRGLARLWLNWWPTKATTIRRCANGSSSAAPSPSSHRVRTARSNTIKTRPSTNSATSSNACSAASRTGAASPHASTANQNPPRRHRRNRHLVVVSPDPRHLTTNHRLLIEGACGRKVSHNHLADSSECRLR